MSRQTRSYQDPLGDHMRALSEERERYLADFPRVASVYDGFYLPFMPEGKPGLAYLAGAEGIVGSDIRFALVENTEPNSSTTASSAVEKRAIVENPESDPSTTASPAVESIGETAPTEDAESAEKAEATEETESIAPTKRIALFNLNGDIIARLSEEASARIYAFIKVGWELRLVLVLVSYNNEIRGFEGQLACLCMNPAVDMAGADAPDRIGTDNKAQTANNTDSPPADRPYVVALRTFIGHITERIAAGDHPGLRLTQQQLVRVIESRGAWYLTKAEPLPDPKRGWAVYKRRTSTTDHLVTAALRHNKGCLVASWLGAVILIAALAWLVWQLARWVWG
ncbi:MAG: hypothetical protein LBI64_04610 [Coriobacteriales bacterium]|jgi:hypothetical protein|nr:hypothetical protein [Coriobacteriales bacterium]